MNWTNKPLRCLVIEDEETPRQAICAALDALPNVQVIGDTGVVTKAYDLIIEKNPDAIFLDIELIGGNAFMILDRLRENNIKIPPTIITTAYPEYGANAINEYHDCIIKYLIKPFFDNLDSKLNQCVDAVRLHTARHDAQSTVAIQAAAMPKIIFLKTREQYIKIEIEKLSWIKVDGTGGVFLMIDDGGEGVQSADVALSKLMEILPDNFLQISRDIVINIHKIKRIDRSNRSVYVCHNNKETELYIGGSYYDRLRQLVLKEVI
jgi:DNA-binding LytR/AlgR family response regulator